jgi:hypothetical protein
MSQVDEAFAWDEGEGDRTRDWWLDAHRRYFARQASREGYELDDELLHGVQALRGRVATRCRRYERRAENRGDRPVTRRRTTAEVSRIAG